MHVLPWTGYLRRQFAAAVGYLPASRIAKVGKIGLPQSECGIDLGALAIYPDVMRKVLARDAGDRRVRPLDLAQQLWMQAIGYVEH